ncbi:MAG: GerAB/ArcD/ProY family transporter [Ectobacillus sp.]
MEQMQAVPKHIMFPSAMLIFIINSMQIGVGITAFSRFVYKYAKQDSWLAVLVAGIVAHIVIFCIYLTLRRYKEKDLFDIHTHLFGKWLGNALSILYIGYLFGYSITYIINLFAFTREYLFPDIPIWIIALLLLVLAVYAVYGGIRVLVGVCFLSVVFTVWITIVLLQIFQYFDWLSFLPVLENRFSDIGMGGYEMSFSLTGFEILYFVYPYVQGKNKANVYAQTGALLTNMIYLFFIVVSIGFYSEKGLKSTIWPSLNLFKIVNFPFLEQFEVVVISLMMLIILPNLSLLLWVVSKGSKKIIAVKQKTALFVASVLLFIGVQRFNTLPQISTYTEFFNLVSSIFSFIYPVVLLLFAIAIDKIRKKRRQA